ncbi:DNA repair protein RadA (chromatophore) [Paulinella micropora]|uniref:DNA repair protein RadA n=1 Tax=Paulinella micropora TaxID=1928728 RepID=A0A1S6YHS2_9EUKA|nr:DNA repair protein RadA [Paulinella micropora]BBL86069.1 DNA repair protein RadA [Paulinella micropora]
MVRSSSIYICTECGAQSYQFFGRCPECSNWNCLIEQKQGSSNTNRNQAFNRNPSKLITKKSELIQEIEELTFPRIKSGYEEFDRVLGGGLVPGSLVLVGGDPGIGKSTLLLQSAMLMCNEMRILYISAEESAQQVTLRWRRLRKASDSYSSCKNQESTGLNLLSETELESILQEIELLNPTVTIVDSIQTIYATELSGGPGSVSQIRECTNALHQLVKRQGTALILVGHITKEGILAGPKTLEHLVDVVLTFEGDRFANYRLLRAKKNRFGATNELSVFEMRNHGLVEIHNPFELFLGSNQATIGVATVVTYEGTRPLILEVQALINSRNYSSPRRTTTGVKTNRLHQILAVLEKHMKLPLSNCDCYVAVAGGLKVDEPGADLGLAAAIIASYRNLILPPCTAFIGELGLGGELRSVNQLQLRLKECARLGFKSIIVPKVDSKQVIRDKSQLSILEASSIADALMIALELK